MDLRERPAVRTVADAARQVIVKLSSILRQLLKKTENFSPLRDELSFIDDYLTIEIARFGEEKLRLEKQIDEPVMGVPIPSMLLQPIVENAIKHGLVPREDGGVIRIGAHPQGRYLMLEVRDNGVGIPREILDQVHQKGIGISNVQERLRVLYGSDFLFHIESPADGGTIIVLGIPINPDATTLS